MNYSTRETWLPIPGYEGFYEVSDHGRVRSLDHVKIDAMGRRRPFIGKVLSPALTQGYPMVTLKVAGKNRSWRVHRLVAMAFLPPPQPGQTDVCQTTATGSMRRSAIFAGTPTEAISATCWHTEPTTSQTVHG